MPNLVRLLAGAVALALAACASPDVVPNDRFASTSAARLAVEPPIGLPEGKVLQLETRVRDQLAQKRVAVAQAGDPAPYKVQGFCSAAPEDSNTQVACVWDVVDTAGERAYRLVTEETARGGRRDPWSAVDGAVLDRIAEQTADGLAAWLPGQPSQPGLLSTTPAPLAAFGGRRFYVGRVTGAPGDGNRTLAAAMVRALQAEGETVVGSATGAYQVRARVNVGKATRGDQSIAIEWQLLDSRGRGLGTVDQENRIAAGALDRNWGQNADNAARAAARGLLQLLSEG